MLALSAASFAQIGVSITFGPPPAASVRAAALSGRGLPVDTRILGL
jgi:hypothetical protein